MEYIVFTDESYISKSRFQSLSAFSFHKSFYNEINDKIQSILIESAVTEFKWAKLKDAKYYFCAEKLIKLILSNIFKCKIRIDTIVWDTHDSRHAIIGRNDLANYERMFFHLLNNTMKKRNRNCSWDIHPDVRGGINWTTIKDCLCSVGNRQEYVNSIFGNFFGDCFASIKWEFLPVKLSG